MNFYNKDRKYRKYFRSTKGADRRFVLIFCVLIVMGISLFLTFGTICAPSGENENNAVSGEISESPAKEENTLGDRIAGSVFKAESSVRRSDTGDYFPDHTPAQGVITDGYGPRTDPEVSFHYAIDIAGEFLSPIYAAASGTVISCGSDEIYGLNAVIDHIYDGYKTKYAHMATYVVSEGMKVKKGDIIGFMGNTGYSTGVHLHFEIIKSRKRLDPAAFIKIKDGRTVLK